MYILIITLTELFICMIVLQCLSYVCAYVCLCCIILFCVFRLAISFLLFFLTLPALGPSVETAFINY